MSVASEALLIRHPTRATLSLQKPVAFFVVQIAILSIEHRDQVIPFVREIFQFLFDSVQPRSLRMDKISYNGYPFPPEIVHQAIWLYLRFTLSLRDVEDLFAERGVAVSCEPVGRWVNYKDAPDNT